ncbi:hypothetical protein [Flavobacterium sp.]|jgi:hypothetical protein|uniref:hypothetical protein n=1 Tax=Flavobacterium sp. TaxID=239 RepID=UPI0037BF2797
MKRFLMLFTATLLHFACSETKSAVVETVPSIYYEASTRGYFLSLKVENKMIYIYKDRNSKEYSDKLVLSEEEWSEISTLAKAVDLAKVKDLKWPTEKRYYDAAAFANIIFESKGIKYPANGFDHGFPPSEIEKLVTKITKLAEKNNEY